MMKDLQLKKILLEMSKMKTKIFDDIDENNHLFENVPGSGDRVKDEREVTVSTFGNPLLESYRIVSCADGQTYIGGTGVEVLQKKENQSATEWLGDQKIKYERKEENWITACEYNADIKILQGAASYGLDKEMSDEKKELKKADLINQCLSMCYNVRNNLPEGCAVYFKMQYPGAGKVPVALVSDSWLRGDYKKWYDRHEAGDDTYKVREPYMVYQNDFRYKFYNEGKWTTFDLKNVANLSEFEGGLKFSKTDGRLSKYDLLPLTNKEKMEMQGNNPFYENNQLKQGEGQYICMRPDASQVNYRTSDKVDEDTGVFDPIDNWIKWDTSDVVGKLLSTSLSVAPEWKDNSSIWNLYLGGGVVQTEQGKKFKSYTESNSSKLFKTVIQIYKDSGNSEYATRLELVSKTEPKSYQEISDKNFELANALRGILRSPHSYDRLPENIKKELNNTGIIHKWYKVELLYPIEDKTDPGKKYSVAFVAADTTEYCKTNEQETNKISNSNFDLESFKRAPLKNLVIGKATFTYK
jgi:hypothetical protein